MAKNRPDPDATYLRSALISMGLALFFLGAFVGYRDAVDLAVAMLIGGFGIGGLGLIAAGLFLPSSKVELWASSAFSHESAWLVLVLAYPVHLVLSPLYRRT